MRKYPLTVPRYLVLMQKPNRLSLTAPSAAHLWWPITPEKRTQLSVAVKTLPKNIKPGWPNGKAPDFYRSLYSRETILRYLAIAGSSPASGVFPFFSFLLSFWFLFFLIFLFAWIVNSWRDSYLLFESFIFPGAFLFVAYITKDIVYFLYDHLPARPALNGILVLGSCKAVQNRQFHYSLPL